MTVKKEIVALARVIFMITTEDKNKYASKKVIVKKMVNDECIERNITLKMLRDFDKMYWEWGMIRDEFKPKEANIEYYRLTKKGKKLIK